MNGNSSSKDVTAFQGIRALADAQVNARSMAPAISTRPRAPDMGSSTLKQNPALMDRLRELAMQSERPPASQSEPEPLSMRDGAPLSVREETKPDVSMDLSDDDLEIVAAEAQMSAPPPSEVTQMQPVTRRARERERERTRTLAMKSRRASRLVGALAVGLAVGTVALGAGMRIARDASPTASVASPRIP